MKLSLLVTILIGSVALSDMFAIDLSGKGEIQSPNSKHVDFEISLDRGKTIRVSMDFTLFDNEIDPIGEPSSAPLVSVEEMDSNRRSSADKSWTSFAFFEHTTSTTSGPETSTQEAVEHPFITELREKKQKPNSVEHFIELFQNYIVRKEQELQGFFEIKEVFYRWVKEKDLFLYFDSKIYFSTLSSHFLFQINQNFVFIRCSYQTVGERELKIGCIEYSRVHRDRNARNSDQNLYANGEVENVIYNDPELDDDRETELVTLQDVENETVVSANISHLFDWKMVKQLYNMKISGA